MIALLLTLSVMYAYFATTLRTTAQRVSQIDTLVYQTFKGMANVEENNEKQEI